VNREGLGASATERAFVAHVVGRDLLGHCARLLHGAGIPALPLKGIWLQLEVYERPEQRVITDVDLLVPDACYRRAQALLLRNGFDINYELQSECTLSHARWPLPLDLHRRLFTRGAFRLPTSAVFERATLVDGAHTGPLWMPDPLDGFAHVVGHFVKSRGEAFQAPRDLCEIARAKGLRPERVAQHLTYCGMGRAARLALDWAMREGYGPFPAEVLGALPPDPMGSALARFCRPLLQWERLPRRLSQLPGFALEANLARGFAVALLRSLEVRKE